MNEKYGLLLLGDSVLLQHSSQFQSAGLFRQRRKRGDVSAKRADRRSSDRLLLAESSCVPLAIHCVLRHAASARPMHRTWPPTTTAVKGAARKLGQRAQSLTRRQKRPVNQYNTVIFNTASLSYIVGENRFVQTYIRA